jgi:hypothetical protein
VNSSLACDADRSFELIGFTKPTAPTWKTLEATATISRAKQLIGEVAERSIAPVLKTVLVFEAASTN